MTVAKATKKWVEDIEKSFLPKMSSFEVPLSVIIPTYNCSASVDLTLSTLQRQNYSSLEVIIIDAGSTDNTRAIIGQYRDLITRVYSVADHDLPEMINRGAALATGEYLAAIFPDCSYISDYTFALFAEAVSNHGHPDLIICESILHADLPVIANMRHRLSLQEGLRKGYSPAPFVCCWFSREFFIENGKVDPRYKTRFGLDLFCRLQKLPHLRSIHLDRTLIDHSRVSDLIEYGWRQVAETGKILKIHFGWRVAFKWFFTLRFRVLMKLMWKNLKSFFFEKS